MRPTTLLKRNLTYYWRIHLAVVLGVATAVAVLAGALLVGDSVRASLRELVLLRLGKADQVITVNGYCREQLADELQSQSRFRSEFRAICPMIVLEGFVTHQESGRRASDVQVYGVDDRFWRFHGGDQAHAGLKQREVLVSAGLVRELASKAGDSLLLRLEKPSEIPAESLHGRKEDSGRTIRLTVGEVLGRPGEFSLRPRQGDVRALFVSLQRLQKELEKEGKVNTLLVSERNPRPEGSASREFLEKLIRETFRLEDLGIKLRILESGQCLALESESALLNETLAKTARETAERMSLRVSPFLTYLVNVIRSGRGEIPYSLVTAVDPDTYQKLLRERPGRESGQRPGNGNRFVNASPYPLASDSTPPPIVLNDWAAHALGVQPGAAVSLDYYVWESAGRLVTQTATFRLEAIVPIGGLAADRDLVPEYPGITASESLSEWDPPFPMDLARIRPRDEEYWQRYRTTPKAFIPLEKGQSLWHSRFGQLSSLRFFLPDAAGKDLPSTLANYRKGLQEAIDPFQSVFSVYPVRAQGLAASQGATDFGEYFLYFSFFLVVSALMLAGLFFKLGVEQRLREIGLLQALGFSAARIRIFFLSEGLLLAGLGSIGGLAGALAYGALMMVGLRTWWSGAVGTTYLHLHVSAISLFWGAVGGVLAALGYIAWTLRSLNPITPRSLLAGNRETAAVARHFKPAKGRHNRLFGPRPLAPTAAWAFTFSGSVLILCAQQKWINQVMGFFGAGTLWLLAILCHQAVWLSGNKRTLLQGKGWWALSRLGIRNATYRPGRSILCVALIASASFIIVALDAFRWGEASSAQDKESGSGGYPLLAESVLPLYYDPNSTEGKLALNLADDSVLKDVAFSRFRVRAGDDTSCLNLYQPRNPKILAPTEEFIRSGRFAFRDSLARSPEEKRNPWLLLEKQIGDGKIPVIADSNSMAYALHLRLGEELILNQGSEHPVGLKLVGALADSLFQSEILMSEPNFLRLFPDQEGYRFFLLDVAPEKTPAVTALLEDRLSDFGFDAIPTSERLAGFHRVENTYLSTFQSLGGLGLVLGTMGLAAVLWRNALERRRELALLQAVGYNPSRLGLIILSENILLLGAGIVTGTLCALLAIVPAFSGHGGILPMVSMGSLLLAVLATGAAASLLATAIALRSPLLPALRSE